MIFTYQGRSIYYERHGEGRPLLVLNGIMMSTPSWKPFIETFKQGGHQVILLDLMDQGRSGSFPEGYDMSGQADMALALLDELNLDTVSLMGTSYGGALALEIACRQALRADRLLLAATRCYTDPAFRGICEGWLHAADTSPEAFYTATIPLFYGATFQEHHRAFMDERRTLLEKTLFNNPDFMARMKRLVRSIMSFDLRDELCRIACPTLILEPEEDLVMMPWEQRRMWEKIPGSELVTLPKTGHVLFLERPGLFVALMMGWFSNREVPRV